MKALHTLVALSCLAFATPAMAENYAENFYIGTSVGEAFHYQDKSDWNGGTPGQTTSYDNQDITFKFYGGYKFNDYLAVEGGYSDFGNYKATVTDGADTGHASVSVHSWNLFAVGIVPVQEKWDVFGKLGISRNRSKMKFSSAGVSYNPTDSGSDSQYSIAWGVGTSYDLTPNLGLRFEFEDFGQAGSSNQNFTVAGKTSDSHPRTLTAGVQYKF